MLEKCESKGVRGCEGAASEVKPRGRRIQAVGLGRNADSTTRLANQGGYSIVNFEKGKPGTTRTGNVWFGGPDLAMDPAKQSRDGRSALATGGQRLARLCKLGRRAQPRDQ
jgi:hypothetical protein